MNNDFFMKLSWKACNNHNELSMKVLKSKYSRCCDWRRNCISKSHDSTLWKDLSSCWNDISKNQAWVVGDEGHLFWNDI